GHVPARAGTTIDRGNPNHTVNFLIPGPDCVNDNALDAYKDFALTVGTTHGEGASVPDVGANDYMRLRFVNVPNPPIHGVLVRDNLPDARGAPLNIPAPSQLDFMNTLANVVKVYPVAAFNYTGFDTIDLPTDLNDLSGPSACGKGWQDLLDTLTNMR